MGNCRLTVQVDLLGFAGPTAVKNFDATEFIKDMELGAATFGSWSYDRPVEVGKEFVGENTERYVVAGEMGRWIVKDTEAGYVIFGHVVDRSVAENVATLLNNDYPDGVKY